MCFIPVSNIAVKAHKGDPARHHVHIVGVVGGGGTERAHWQRHPEPLMSLNCTQMLIKLVNGSVTYTTCPQRQ